MQILTNHWLDCLVGCAVAGSMLGALLFGTEMRRVPRKTIRLSEMQSNLRVWRANWPPGISENIVPKHACGTGGVPVCLR
jgi:hypothetical protein